MQEPAPICPDAPRYLPEAPLPRYRFVPGLHPHPRRDADGSLHGAPLHLPGLPAARWREDHSYLLGVDLYHAGYLWESHEAWEACLAAAREPAHRDLLQALIQLAAALLQQHRGRMNGAARLARSAARRLEGAIAVLPEGRKLAGADPHSLLTQLRDHFDAGGPAPRIVLA